MNAEVAQPWRLYGDAAPDVVAAGHSHVAALLQSLQAAGGPVVAGAAVAYSIDHLAGPPSGLSYWDFVLESAQDRALVILWNGNQHQASFLIAPDPPICIDQGSEAEGFSYNVRVPRMMLRAHWDPTFDELVAVLHRVPDRTSVLVLGTPPPKRESAIRQSLASEALYLKYADELGLDVARLPLTPEPDRMAMWELLQEMLRERADAAGVRFISVPRACSDARGFLLPEFSFADATHANAAYGDLLWMEIAQHLDLRMTQKSAVHQ